MTDRFRTKGGYVLPERTWVAEYYSKDTCTAGFTWHQYASGLVSNRSGTYCSMFDHVTPGFKRKQREGLVAFNPCYIKKTTINPATGSDGVAEDRSTVQCPSNGPYYTIYRYRNYGACLLESQFSPGPGGHLALTPIISGADVKSAMREVSTSVENCRGRANSNLYESLAQGDKALSLLPGLAKNLLQTATRSGIKRKIQAGASAYLAVRYGLQPLMMDMEQVLHGLTTLLGISRQTCRGSVTLQESRTSFSTGSAAWQTHDIALTRSDTCVVRAMSLDEFNATLMSNLGFTQKGLTTVAWDLLPFSFVVDWFANVGDFIGALVPAVGYNQLGSCISVRTTSNVAATLVNPRVSSPWVLVTPFTCSKTGVVETYERTTGLLAPSLVVKNDFRLSNLKRAGDAIALLVQFLR